MDKKGTAWSSLTSFFIRHSMAIFLVATVVCLVLAGYLTNHLKPHVIGVWVVVGILTSLLFSGVALVVVLAVAAVEKARHLKLIAYEPFANTNAKENFDGEKVKMLDFYSPFSIVNNNKYFKNCEIEGPGNVFLDDSNTFENCSFHLCDCILVDAADRVKTAAVFGQSTFVGCRFVNVAFFMTENVARKILASQDAATTGDALVFVGGRTPS